VGVTGTNGKTTTSRWLAAVLNAVAPPVALMTTTGCQLGDAPFENTAKFAGQLDLMAQLLRAHGTYAVLETTSEVLARGLASVWPYRVGVFTNLTQDHLDAHLSPEHYFASKAQLFAHLPADGIAVLNACDEVSPLLREVIPEGVRIVTYGVPSRGRPELPLTLSADHVRVSFEGTQAQLRSPEFGLHDVELCTTGIGAIYIENALAALAAALALGVDVKVALSVLATATPPEGRFEVIHRNPDVVVDYAHTPDALSRTLHTARSLSRGKVWVVFGAGGHRDRAKRPLLGQAAEVADHVVLTSDNPRDENPDDIAEAIRAGMKDRNRATFIRDRRRAIEFVLSHCGNEDVVLIAGKGHERAQTDSSGSRPFSDRSVALELLVQLTQRA
jgi:UDP-N-acetylmuramoyl-L-alanyl-D-glutamate--2,6-diaminopimelate ligase